MLLSIITINLNNAVGLKKTMDSVLQQTCKDFEYIVIDGASSDGSVAVISEYENAFAGRLRWISEHDKGIYNAMNKGVRLAGGRYVQILNSGDTLCSPDVVALMKDALSNNGLPPILYGNMIKCYPDGRRICDKCFAGQPITMLGMYSGTLNHNPTFIKRELFDKYGYYDEEMKICSDWKWFMSSIVLGGECVEYVDINVTTFDMTGISENKKNRDIILSERRQYLESIVPRAILDDYDKYAGDIYMVRRIRSHRCAFKVVYCIERGISKFEKYRSRKKQVKVWG